MDEHINFSAKYKSWIVVKKMKVVEETEDLDVGRLLLSIRETLDDKIYEFMGEDFDLVALGKKVDEMVPKGKLKAEEMASVIKELKSTKTTKMLKEFSEDKHKLEVYKQLFSDMVIRRLNPNPLTQKQLDKYIDDKHRRL